MRDDMHKVICERERRGSREYSPTKGLEKAYRNRGSEDEYDDLDSLPRRESPKFRLGSDGRSFNEHLQPLRRFLEKQVGRPWNKVHSEIHKVIGTNSVVHRHVHQHIRDYVAENIVEVDGKLYEQVTARFYRSKRGLIPLDHENSFVYLYVHPRTGLLRKHRNYGSSGFNPIVGRKRREDELASRMRKTTDSLLQLHKIKGIWYEVTLARATAPDAPAMDAMSRPMTRRKFYDDAALTGVSKRIIGTKRLRALGLVNDTLV